MQQNTSNSQSVDSDVKAAAKPASPRSEDNAGGHAGRYGQGEPQATPTGARDEATVSGMPKDDSVNGPSGDITGTVYDENPNTRGDKQPDAQKAGA